MFVPCKKSVVRAINHNSKRIKQLFTSGEKTRNVKGYLVGIYFMAQVVAIASFIPT